MAASVSLGRKQTLAKLLSYRRPIMLWSLPCPRSLHHHPLSKPQHVLPWLSPSIGPLCTPLASAKGHKVEEVEDPPF